MTDCFASLAMTAKTWRILSTPPLTGQENMAMDEAALDQVEHQEAPPTLRFFRWSRPTLSFGRLQNWDSIRRFIPQGWYAVQRPTGGGIVFHDQDACFSLVWKDGDSPLPSRIKDVYPWIHAVVQEALAPWLTLNLATCQDCRASGSPFQERQCFETPVAYDLIQKSQKIVGGAIARQKNSFLYQGTIQAPLNSEALQALEDAFERRFL